MYLYENHLGGLYSNIDYIDYDDLHCDYCGDSDSLLGYFKTKEDIKKFLYNYYDCNCEYTDEIQQLGYTREEYEEEIKQRKKVADDKLIYLWIEY